MKKCRIEINSCYLILYYKDMKSVYDIQNIIDIQLIHTKPKISNKGSVIKISFSDQIIVCLSFGVSYFTPSALAILSQTNMLNDLLHEKINKLL